MFSCGFHYVYRAIQEERSIFWEVTVWIIARRLYERVSDSELLQRDSRLDLQTSVRSFFVCSVRRRGKCTKETSIKETIARSLARILDAAACIKKCEDQT